MRLDDLCERVNLLEADAKLSLRNSIERDIKNSVKNANSWQGIRYADFASLIVKMAFEKSAAAKKTGSKATYNAPGWIALSKSINKEIEELANSTNGFFVNTTVTWQSVAQFATLATVKEGSRTEIYHKLAFFVWRIWERGVLASEFFTKFLTANEVSVFESIPQAVKSYLFETSELVSTTGVSADLLPATEDVKRSHSDKSVAVAPVEAPTVSVHFQLKDENVAELKSYCDRFAFGSDGFVHAVIYRPRLSNPSALMKTFLAIKPPSVVRDVAKSSYVFTHVYRPVSPTKFDRIASGKVVPLDDAIYFIGGQGPWIKSFGEERRRVPFKSSKIVVVRWEDISQHHFLVPGVTISTNGSGRVISSRVAIRITPVDHSDKIKLREVSCENLFSDLKSDLANEAKIIADLLADGTNRDGGEFLRNAHHFMQYDEDDEIREVAKTILSFSNNAPGRDVRLTLAENFVDGTGAALRASSLMSKLDAALRENPGPYRNASGEELDIWKHLRFGPLQIE